MSNRAAGTGGCEKSLPHRPHRCVSRGEYAQCISLWGAPATRCNDQSAFLSWRNHTAHCGVSEHTHFDLGRPLDRLLKVGHCAHSRPAEVQRITTVVTSKRATRASSAHRTVDFAARRGIRRRSFTELGQRQSWSEVECHLKTAVWRRAWRLEGAGSGNEVGSGFGMLINTSELPFAGRRRGRVESW